MKRWLWRTAVLMFTVAVLASFTGLSEASVFGVGDVQFSFGQVVTLVAIGAAWGEMRAHVAESKTRIDGIEKRLGNLEVRHLNNREG